MIDLLLIILKPKSATRIAYISSNISNSIKIEKQTMFTLIWE